MCSPLPVFGSPFSSLTRIFVQHMKKGKKVNNGFQEQNRQSEILPETGLKRFIGNAIAQQEPSFFSFPF
jgi:hypothetical protein